MIKINNINKIYNTKSKEKIFALKNVNIVFDQNELVFILGQSGSGKTTLLNLLGGLDTPTNGNIIVDDLLLGKDISLELYRQNYVGFVFQEYNLLDGLSVYDNIALAINSTKEIVDQKVKEVLDKVELSGFENRQINELSGGQKQRVAIARALAKNCKILLCDEPTGNLDSKTGNEIFTLLKNISKYKIVIVVSHNEESAKEFADRFIKISDGNITLDERINVNNISDKKIECLSINNKVNFRYKLKIAFHNLFQRKFKTIVCFLLLFLTMFSLCTMQICMSYNCEKDVAKTITDNKEILVMKNCYRDELTPIGIDNTDPSIPLDDYVYTLVDKEKVTDMYETFYGNIFIGDCDEEFYDKVDLDDHNAYVTDYFIDIVVNLDKDYTKLEYKEYKDLIGKEVKYEDATLFTIGGIIKTDYKTYYDEKGKLREEYNYKKIADQFTNHNKNLSTFQTYESMYNYIIEYVYKAIYTTIESFENMYISEVYYLYYNNEKQIHIKNNDTINNMENLYIWFSNTLYSRAFEYYDNSGYVYSTYKDDDDEIDSYVKYKEVKDDEIIISYNLYDIIFKDDDIDWYEFIGNYVQRAGNITAYDGLYENKLPHIGEKISISILDENGNTILEIKDKTIVGVSKMRYNDDSLFIYGTKEGFSIKNTFLSDVVVQKVDWSNIKNKYGFLKDLRKEDIVVMGTQLLDIYILKPVLVTFDYFFMGIAIVFSILTLISIINLVNSKISDNKKEIGILMGIGFNGKEIVFSYLLSIIIITLISLILTIICGYIGVEIVNYLLQILPYTNTVFFIFNIFTYVTLLITCTMIIIISMIPLLSLTKKKPIDVIK